MNRGAARIQSGDQWQPAVTDEPLHEGIVGKGPVRARPIGHAPEPYATPASVTIIPAVLPQAVTTARWIQNPATGPLAASRYSRPLQTADAMAPNDVAPAVRMLLWLCTLPSALNL
ncbi:hypothetical protein Areg01_80600 [Actinoplanes regularis]|nr:hypothetical protein Areg01_80600 [Actinoplanes regularis]